MADSRSTPAPRGPSSSLFDVLTFLIKNRDSLPDASADPAEVKAWLANDLSDWPWDLIPDIYNDVTAIPSDLTKLLTPYTYVSDLAALLKSGVAKGKTLAPGLSKNLTAGISRVTGHISIVQAIGSELGHYERRFGYASNSIASLCKIVGHTGPAPELTNAIKALVSDPKTGAPTALLDLATFFIVQAFPLVRVAESLLTQGFSGIWSKLFPIGLLAGDLDKWINDSTIVDEERDFRKEMVAAVDHYCRGKFSEGAGGGQPVPVGSGNSGGLRAMDHRLGDETLADFGSVLLSTIFGYVIRHPSLPSPIVHKMEWAQPFTACRRADDAGSELAITLSRHLGYQLKAVSGLYLRGFWDVSTMNNSLVESVVSLVSNTVSGILEAFFHDLFWSVEIHEAYPDDPNAGQKVWGWATQELVNGQPSKVMQYNVYVRPGILAEAEAATLASIINSTPALQNLLKDYGAYQDSMRDYRPDDLGSGITTDSISGVSNSGAQVQAKSTFPTSFLSIPVLRAYCNGAYVVLDHGPVSAGTVVYTGTLTAAPAGSMIYVRSNYGDMSLYMAK